MMVRSRVRGRIRVRMASHLWARGAPWGDNQGKPWGDNQGTLGLTCGRAAGELDALRRGNDAVRS